MSKAKSSHFRWVICGMLFFATTVNYMDRQVLGLLQSAISKDLHWTNTDYGRITSMFLIAYALGLVVVGRFIDRIGVKRGLGISVFLWSMASMAHSLMKNVFGFGIARFALGIGESGNFPASNKTVAEWFPKKERAIAFGIFNAGSNVGVLVAAISIPLLAAAFGWRAGFLFTGSLDLIWLVVWLLIYKSPAHNKAVSKAELKYIKSDEDVPDKKVPWLRILGHKQTWAFAIAKFMTDQAWWFYLFWIPGFLNRQYHMNLTQIGLPLVVIYLMADAGSVGGGWLSSFLIKKGKSVNFSRKLTMLICAVLVVPIFMASQVAGMWAAVFIIGLATFAHQGWSANLYTLVSDTCPQHTVSSVTGFGGMAGAISGALLANVIGPILDHTQSYFIPFLIPAASYLIALLVIQLLLPKLEKMHYIHEEQLQTPGPDKD